MNEETIFDCDEQLSNGSQRADNSDVILMSQSHSDSHSQCDTIDEESFSNLRDRHFKGIPSLHKAFTIEKRVKNHRNYKCKYCSLVVITNEKARLVRHAKNCSKMDSEVVDEITIEYDSLVPIRSEEEIDQQRSYLLAKLIIGNNIPLRMLESNSFKNYLNSFNQDIKPPSRHQMITKVIPIVSKGLETKFMSKLQKKTPNLAVEFDHWTDGNRKSIFGVVLTEESGNRYLLSLQDMTLLGHSTNAIVSSFRKSFQSFPTEALNSLVSDSASSCEKARKEIVKLQQYKHIIHHRCLAHLMNNMANHFLKQEPVRLKLQLASTIYTNVCNFNTFKALLRKNEIN